MSLAPTRIVALTLLSLALIVPAQPVMAEEPPPPDPAPVSRLGAPEIFGYLTNWDLDAHIDYGAITTVAYFGLAANADGSLGRYNSNGSKTIGYSRWLGSKTQAHIDQARANGVKFVLTVERMAWETAAKETTRALLSSPAARQALAADITAEISARGVDGVSLDFEPILSDQRDNFAAFLGELRAALDAVNPAYQLTFAATGSQSSLTYEMFGTVTAAGLADAVIIMGYPLRGGGAQRAGGLAPMSSPTSYDLVEVVDAYLRRVAPDKVILALPWYGRIWSTQTDALNSDVQEDQALYGRQNSMGYASAISYATAYGRVVHPEELSALTQFRWRYCTGCPEIWRQIYYDDVETIGAKYDYAAARGLAGIGVWALGYDNEQPEMWQLLRIKYRGLIDNTAPTGSFALAADENFCRAPRVRLRFTLDDGADGSGPVYVRLSNAPDTAAGGLLVAGRTYPAASELEWPLDDATTGGVPGTGPRTVYAQWADVAGNWSPVADATVSLADLATVASVTVAGGAAVVSTANVPVVVEHTAGRAISTIRVSSSSLTSGGVLVNAVESAESILDFSVIDPATGGSDADGRHEIYVQWRDGAGCWSDVAGTALMLDRTAPVGDLAFSDGATIVLQPLVGVLAPATDEVSGVGAVDLSNDGLTWMSFAASNEPIVWSAGDTPDGQWTISARWRDAAGNVSPVATASVLLDTHGPSGTLVLDGGASATSADSVTIDAPATDAASDVVELVLANSPTMIDGQLSDGQSFPATSVVGAWPLAGAGTPEGPADGVHAVYAQWRDAVGHWSDVASASIIVDRTPPIVGVPLPGLEPGTVLAAGEVVIGATWAADDAGSGIATQLLEISGDGQSWSPIALGDGADIATRIQLDQLWRLRISATDTTGNTSEAAESEPFSASLTEDSSAAVTYRGTWLTATPSGASNGTTHYSTARRATARLAFTGRSVAWVAPTGPNAGVAKVIIDGVVVARIDLRAVTQQRRLVFASTWASVGAHVIKIRVLGTAGRPRVDVDALVVMT